MSEADELRPFISANDGTYVERDEPVFLDTVSRPLLLHRPPDWTPPEPFRMPPEAEHLARYCSGSGCRSPLHQPNRDVGEEGGQR